MMSTLEVCEARLAGNVRAIEQVLAGVGAPELLGVVKANAYGHSAALCAPMLADVGVRWFGVTDAREGAVVRESLGGRDAAILIMSGPPGDAAGARRAAEMAVRHGLTPTVWTRGQVEAMACACGAEGTPVHLEIDTGMSRQGVAWDRMDAVLDVLAREPRVRLDGVFTHLASAECGDGRQTLEQIERFEEAVGRVAAAGLRPRWVHVGNAATIDNGSAAAEGTIPRLVRLAESVEARAMVRCGLGLYGLCMPVEGDEGAARLRQDLQPVMTWRTTITAVSEIASGTAVGYGATFVARRRMRLALLPVGYADGLRRELSSTTEKGGGWVVIAGQRAPIVGRVSMNLTTVDVSGVTPEPQAGDAVTLLGPGVTAEEHGALCGTLAYEILCGVRGRHVRG